VLRDLLILEKTGVLLFKKNFGECHSFGSDPDLISGFLAAIVHYASIASEQPLGGIDFGTLKMAIKINKERIYAILYENTDDPKVMQTRLQRIIELFDNTYEKELKEFNGDVSKFDKFGEKLIELKMAQKNCGGRPECKGCPNSSKLLPLKLFINKLRGN